MSGAIFGVTYQDQREIRLIRDITLKMNKYALAVIAAITTCGTAVSQELEYSIQARPSSLKIGDRVVFTLTYTNRSNRDLLIYPTYYSYQALDTYFVNIKTGKPGELVPYLSPPHFDCEVVSSKSKMLRPGQVYKRSVSATVSLSLPPKNYWIDKRPGLYVTFDDSAVKLPGFGRYKLSSCYRGAKGWKECLRPPQQNALWVGKVCTSDEMVEFHR
jgi:hypothetical protein